MYNRTKRRSIIMFTGSLTIHFDMEGNGGIGQIALGIEGVLSLLLGIHPLQLQASVVPKERKSDGK